MTDDFCGALRSAGLSDVDFDGSEFTWMNNRVWQRLYRIVVNAAWNLAYSSCHISHLARGRSNHSSCWSHLSMGHSGKGLSSS